MKTKTDLRLSILSALMILILGSCYTPKPLPTRTAAAPTPTMEMVSVELPADQANFFLLMDKTPIPLKAQHLTERESVYGYGLPQTDEPQPLAIISGGSIDPDNLLLRRMIGGIGFYPQPNRDLGGVVVQAVRPGFGADTGGLQIGDLILAVDDEPLKEMLFFADFDARFQKVIMGELGSRVSLTIERAGSEIELDIPRDLPTLPSVTNVTTGSIPLRQAEGQGQIQLVPEAALTPGLYCYQAGLSASSFGDLYCFIEGNLEVTWPVPPATLAGTRDLFTSPNFQRTDCRFTVEPGQVVECADLTVPEDYSQPDGKTIRLHVAVFRSLSDPQPDPVIYLHGGPGGGALSWASAMAYAWGRDFIAFDQRGTGYSEPRLDCPLLADEYAKSLSENQRISSLGWEADHLDACRKNLENRGINLAAYTSLSNAADLHTLIQALGYEQTNLFGQSYGTYLALTFMREYGSEGLIRSAVLDGVSPPQADLFAERGKTAQAQVNAVFAACDADPACGKAYPDLEVRFYKLLERLAAQPITMQTNNPLNGRSQPVIVNDFRLIEAIYRSIYESKWISKLPALIATLERGDSSLLEPAVQNIFLSAASVDQGIYYAVTCGNEANFTSAEAIRAGNAQLSTPFQAFFDDTALKMFAACQNWPAAPASPSKNQPAVSEIPTLLLSGVFDPVTSPAWARLASETLSKGYLFEFPAEAHDLMVSNSCAQTLTYKFIENPVEPSDVCLDYLTGPTFETP